MSETMLERDTIVELIDEKIGAEAYYGSRPESNGEEMQAITALEDFREIFLRALPGVCKVNVEYALGLLDSQIYEVRFTLDPKVNRLIQRGALEDLTLQIKFTAGLVDEEGNPLE